MYELPPTEIDNRQTRYMIFNDTNYGNSSTSLMIVFPVELIPRPVRADMIIIGSQFFQ